jgi:hypothetical protein
LTIRFQADNDLKFAIVKAVRRREPAIDFASAQDASIRGLPDPVLLDRAAEENRVLVSHDRRTMFHHFRRHLAAGKSSPGLLIVSQNASVAAVVDAIVVLWVAAEPQELRDQVFHLPSLVRHAFPH